MNIRNAAQIVALSAIVKALVATHQNHGALRAALREVAKDGFANADDEMQAEIDRSILNWMNGLRVERHQD